MNNEGFDFEVVAQGYFDDDTNGNATYRVECTVIHLNQWTVEMYQKAYGLHRSELSERARAKLQMLSVRLNDPTPRSLCEC